MDNVHRVFLSFYLRDHLSIFNFGFSYLVLGLRCVTIDCWEPFFFLSLLLSFFLYLLGPSLLVNFNFWFAPCIVEIVRCCAQYWDELVSFCLSVCLPTYTYLPAYRTCIYIIIYILFPTLKATLASFFPRPLS